MSGMSIGEVARRAGVAPSAIRYYESLGLLPTPERSGGKRRYHDTILSWLALVTLAREAGFTMAETRQLVAGFEPGTPPAARWHALAARKLAEIDAARRTVRLAVARRRRSAPAHPPPARPAPGGLMGCHCRPLDAGTYSRILLGIRI